MDFQGGMIVLIVFVSLFAIWLLFYFCLLYTSDAADEL